MHILKFGGTSLGNSTRILNVFNIIKERSQVTRVGVVVSAIAGVTNYLSTSIKKALEDTDVAQLVALFRSHHEEIIANLTKQKTNLSCDELYRHLDEICREYTSLLSGIQLIKTCPDIVYPQILSLGERLSVRIMHALMLADQIEIEWLDAGDYIKTKGNYCEGLPLIKEIEQRFNKFKQQSPRILLMAGFIASNMENKLTLLGRNGSDYSAALMAIGLQAECCEIWTDVDGIYTADPKLVSDAKLISDMSYGEAMELSFYGAKILHPKTIAPLVTHRIPVWIRNSLNPSARGTKVHHNNTVEKNNTVRGISCLDQIALINIYGPGMKGVPGLLRAFFQLFTNVIYRSCSLPNRVRNIQFVFV